MSLYQIVSKFILLSRDAKEHYADLVELYDRAIYEEGADLESIIEEIMVLLL